MKRTLLALFVLLASAATAMAQSMKVFQNGQLKAIYYISKSDSVVFSEDFPFPPGGDEEVDPINPVNPDSEKPMPYTHAVDLGLSVKWADMNVGAQKATDYGLYLAWGEMEEKDTYTRDTYFEPKYTKYNNLNKTVLDLMDDSANGNWGGVWRMPTKAEQDELRTKCTWTWTTQDDVYGMKVTGPNGNSIFLPASGYRGNNSLDEVGSYGYYWSSSLDDHYDHNAYFLKIYTDKVSYNYRTRYQGCSVRAVCPK